MTTKLFVGGLPYETTQAELLKMFSAAGAVFGIKLIMDKETGRSKGYAFVEMATEADAKAAMEKLNGAPIGGRKMFLSEARPQEKKDAPGLPPSVAAPAPGFVERRSGKDRRVRPGFGAPGRPSTPSPSAGAPAPADRRAAPVEEKKWSSKFGFGEKKSFGDKPAGYAGKKPWADKKPFGEKKPWADKKPFGDKKPWADKKPWGDKAPGDRKPWADRKAWADKPASGEKAPRYEKKPWSDLPTGGKKPWSGKPPAGGKPGAGKKPWGRKPEGKPGGFTRKVRRGSN
jgi:RNA recognition motif-containing protein